jgi:hypothetical protein
MYNFEHEISYIPNRFLRWYFDNDYFHDGSIHEIETVEDDLILYISAYREWENDNLINQRCNIFDEKYMYKCTFQNCRYYLCEISDNGLIYLNGRFKDSAYLHHINKTSRRKNCHLRIQTTGGYIDIIFSDFKIEKIIGSETLPQKVSNIRLHEVAREKFYGMDISRIRNIAKQGNSLERMWAIEYLGSIKDEEAVDISLENLNEEYAEIAAIWTLGILGEKENLNNLYKKWGSEKGLIKRHIQDAIEKILERSQQV